MFCMSLHVLFIQFILSSLKFIFISCKKLSSWQGKEERKNEQILRGNILAYLAPDLAVGGGWVCSF